MSEPKLPANDAEEPLDPEILALLDFEPVPRRAKKEGGWSAEMQRLFIARLAVHGSPGKACNELGKYRSGIDKVAKCDGSESFREAWDKAVELAERRQAGRVAAASASRAEIRLPFVDNRRKFAPSPLPSPARGEGEEDEDAGSFRRRGEEAMDSIAMKLVRCRRAYLAEIAGSAGKRAAFEVLTELPVDWEKAGKLEPQPFEPWTRTNQRQADMVLTAESGWSFGEFGYGPDKKRRAREALNAWRGQNG